MDNKLRIAFFGEDSFSTVILNSLIKAGHEICLVVTPYYDNVVYKRLELICNRNGIRFYRTKKINSDQTASVLKEANPQLCVISHFERLIKKHDAASHAIRQNDNVRIFRFQALYRIAAQDL